MQEMKCQTEPHRFGWKMMQSKYKPILFFFAFVFQSKRVIHSISVCGWFFLLFGIFLPFRLRIRISYGWMRKPMLSCVVPQYVSGSIVRCVCMKLVEIERVESANINRYTICQSGKCSHAFGIFTLYMYGYGRKWDKTKKVETNGIDKSKKRNAHIYSELRICDRTTEQDKTIRFKMLSVSWTDSVESRLKQSRDEFTQGT